MRSHKSLGRTGETVTRSYLEGQGWNILAVNWRSHQGEIDIIAEEPAPEGACLVFVEVKARTGNGHGVPVEAVDQRKRQKLVNVANAWLAARNAGGPEPHCRFDVAEVFFDPDGFCRVALRRGAFGAGD